MEGAKRGFARGRVWPRRLLDARRYPLSRYRRGGASSETRFTKRTAALGSIDFPHGARSRGNSSLRAHGKQSAIFFRQSGALAASGAAAALVPPLSVRARGCRAGVSARSPSEMGKKAKGKHRLGACPLPSSPNRAPAWMHPRRFLGTAAAGADSEEKAPMTRAPPERRRRRRVRHPARLRSRDAVSRRELPRARIIPRPFRSLASPRLPPPRPNATPILTHRRSSSFVSDPPQTSSTTWRRSRATARARRSSSCS